MHVHDVDIYDVDIYDVHVHDVHTHDIHANEDNGDRPRPPTILLVEDERFVREAAAGILNAAGYCVLKARNAREARKIFHSRQSAIQLLIVDVILPGANGCELSRELSVLHPQMKTVFVSGHPEIVVAEKPAGALPLFFLAKPYTVENLLQIVNLALTSILQNLPVATAPVTNADALTAQPVLS